MAQMMQFVMKQMAEDRRIAAEKEEKRRNEAERAAAEKAALEREEKHLKAEAEKEEKR